MAGTYMPRRMKYAKGNGATKRRKAYARNSRKATKYTGVRTMIGRTSQGMSKYRFTGYSATVAKGTWRWVRTLQRDGSVVVGLMQQVGGTKKIAASLYNPPGGKGSRKMLVHDIRNWN